MASISEPSLEMLVPVCNTAQSTKVKLHPMTADNSVSLNSSILGKFKTTNQELEELALKSQKLNSHPFPQSIKEDEPKLQLLRNNV